MAELKDVLAKLNRYLNIKGSSDMIKTLLEPNISATSESSNTQPADEMSKNPKLEDFIISLLSIQQEGQFTIDLVDVMNEYISSAVNENLSNDSLAKRLNDASKSPIHISTWDTGGDREPPYFHRSDSIKSIMKAEDISTDSRGISVVEITDKKLNFSNRDTSPVQAFLQLLPSIEISKAVPFFECKVITNQSYSKDQGEPDASTLFSQGISLGKFLNGKINGDGSINDKILLAKFDKGQTVQKEVLNNTNANLSSIASAASMELFTSPQTLVNANARYYDLDAYSKGSIPGEEEKASVIDPFRPLMTFQSFNLQVTPATGMISTKAADVKLMLHDRSRMNEIAPLLTPSRLGDIEFHVEWGWSHPQGNPLDPNPNYDENVFGSLINMMRCKERYGVVNSSYSFTPEGQVDISLKLYTKGAQNVAYDLVKGEGESSPALKVQEATRTLREKMRELRGDGFKLKEDFGAPDFLGKASSTKGLLALDDEQKEKLQEFITNLKKINSQSKGKPFSDLVSGLETAQEAAKEFSEQAEAAFDKKLKAMKEGLDPWLIPHKCTVGKKDVAVIEPDTHISFAKFLLHMLGQPMLETKKFEEIQFIFYPINKYAMFAKDLNIGQYPLNKKLLDDMLKEELKKTPSMRIQTMLNIVQKIYMHNMADDIYGLSEVFPDKNKKEVAKKYKKNKPKTETKTKTGETTAGSTTGGTTTGAGEAPKVGDAQTNTTTKKKSNKPKQNDDQINKQKMALRKAEILKACYGENGVKRFKRPSIVLFIETVPSALDGKTILRFHLSDRNCSAYSTYEELWNASNKSELGVIGQYKHAKLKYDSLKTPNPKNDKKLREEYNQKKDEYAKRKSDLEEESKASIEKLVEEGILEQLDNGRYKIQGGPSKIRELLATNMPTLKYGTEFSGILSANLSTQSNPQMETIHMQRARRSGNKPLSSESDGLPLRVKPAQLSLDTFGCPLINFGQQFFIDFGTNSSIDDVYSVTGISHSLSPTEFKSSIKLVPLQKFGQFSSAVDSLNDLAALAKSEQSEE